MNHLQSSSLLRDKRVFLAICPDLHYRKRYDGELKIWHSEGRAYIIQNAISCKGWTILVFTIVSNPISLHVYPQKANRRKLPNI